MENKTNTSFRPFIIGCLIIVGVWLGSIWLNIALFENPHNDTAAWFGDSFGGINTLFSGLAFAGIIYTILLQRSELQLQREELKQTRVELHRSADAQENSEAAFNKQVFLMSKTAELNALNSRMQFCEIMSRVHINNSGVRTNYIKMMGEVNKKMEKVLDEINKVTLE